MQNRRRKDTSIEAVGAEHLVKGFLMREGIQTYLADQRQEGYDLICVNPSNRKSVLIQVKSRWATNCDRGFPLNKTNSDFIAIVFLNCGYSWGRKGEGKKEPEIYIVPTEVCIEHQRKDGWKKVMTRKIPDFGEKYRNNWKLVKDALGI